MYLTESALRRMIRERILSSDPGSKKVDNHTLSEGIQFHLDNRIPLHENIYRWGSENHLAMMREARELYEDGIIDLDEEDSFLLGTDIGEKGLYNGVMVPLDLPFEEGDDELDIFEAKYQGKDVELNQPTRSSGPSKFSVYVKNEKGKVIKLGFGSKGIDIKTHSPERVRSFLARHNCDNPGPRWKARWWSCNLHRYKKQLGLKFKGRW